MNLTETKNNKRIIKKVIAIAMCTMMAVSFCCVSASAATNTLTSKSWSLSKSQKSSKSENTSVTKSYGKITKLSNSASSNDGVNLYLYYSVPGESWKEAQHVFAEKGNTISANSYYKAPSKSIWCGKMCSWWWNGKNCSATGEFNTK